MHDNGAVPNPVAPRSEIPGGGRYLVLHLAGRWLRPSKLLGGLGHPLICLALALLGQHLLASWGSWGGGLLLVGAAALFAAASSARNTAPDGILDDQSPRWGVGDLAVLLGVTVLAA